MLRKAVCALLLWTALLPVVSAEATIDRENLYANRYPGYCVWITLRMMGMQYNIPELQNIDEQRDEMPPETYFAIVGGSRIGAIELPRCGGTPSTCKEHLDRLKINYKLVEGSEAALEAARASVARGVACCVAVGDTTSHWDDCPLGDHAILVLNVTDEWVTFIDCNQPTTPDGRIRICYWATDEFQYYIQWVIVVTPPEPAK